MAIGPQGPLLKNDGPACRVCGCTEHNACVMIALVQTSKRRAREMTIGCSWVKVEGGTEPLCSACSGTVQDLAEAIERGFRMWGQYGPVEFVLTVLKAANARFKAREKAEGRK